MAFHGKVTWKKTLLSSRKHSLWLFISFKVKRNKVMLVSWTHLWHLISMLERKGTAWNAADNKRNKDSVYGNKVGEKQLFVCTWIRRQSRLSELMEYLWTQRRAAGAASSPVPWIEMLIKRKRGRTKWFLVICMMQVWLKPTPPHFPVGFNEHLWLISLKGDSVH